MTPAFPSQPLSFSQVVYYGIEITRKLRCMKPRERTAAVKFFKQWAQEIEQIDYNQRATLSGLPQETRREPTPICAVFPTNIQSDHGKKNELVPEVATCTTTNVECHVQVANYKKRAIDTVGTEAITVDAPSRPQEKRIKHTILQPSSQLVPAELAATSFLVDTDNPYQQQHVAQSRADKNASGLQSSTSTSNANTTVITSTEHLRKDICSVLPPLYATQIGGTASTTASPPGTRASQDQDSTAAVDDCTRKTTLAQPFPVLHLPSKEVGRLALEEERLVQSGATEVELPISAKPKKLRSARQPRAHHLEEITYSLTIEVDQAKITQVRNEFHKELLLAQAEVQASNTTILQGFTPNEATDITNLFFTDFIGWPALKRLKDVVSGYNKGSTEGLSLSAIVRADRMASEPNTPEFLREYYATFSRASRHANQGNMYSGAVAQFNNIESLILNVKLHQLQAAIMETVEDKDDEFHKLLLIAGFKTRRGYGWRSCALDYIAQSIGLPKTTLDLCHQQAETVAHVVRLFGPGVLTIFPVHAIWRMRKWGLQRMSTAFDIFKRLCPYLLPICTFLEQHVYRPITCGLPITLNSRSLTGDTSFLEQIQNAIVCVAVEAECSDKQTSSKQVRKVRST